MNSVAFVQPSANLDGSAVSGRMLMNGFRQAGWSVQAIFAFDGPMVEIMEKEGFQVSIIPHKNWLRTSSPLRFGKIMCQEWAAAGRFVKAFQAHQPDLVYVNSIISLAAAEAARRLHIPTVWHARELFSDVNGELVLPRFLGKRLIQHIMRKRADAFIAISKKVRENILGSPLPVNTHIINNAVSQDMFTPKTTTTTEAAREALAVPRDRFLIGVPANLRPVKGIPFLLKALPDVVSKFPKCLFVITGDGTEEYRQALLKQVHTLGLGQHVHFTGQLKDMSQLYHACQIACIPSRSEAFGRTAIECFASRTPVVASAVGGLLEIIKDQETGLLVAYQDTDQLARTLVSLIQDDSLRERLTENAFRRAQECFTETDYHRRVISVAETVLKSRRTTRPE